MVPCSSFYLYCCPSIEAFSFFFAKMFMKWREETQQNGPPLRRMKKHHAWQVYRLHAVSVLIILLLFPLATATPNTSSQLTKCIRSIPRSFSQSHQQQLCVASSRSWQDPTVPGQCAKMALGGRALQSAKFAPRIELLRAASIVQLCSGTPHTGPANCWLAAPSQVRQQMLVASASATGKPSEEWDAESEAALLSLVQVCRRAQDDRPAKCFLLWLEMSRTLNKRDAYDALETAIALCRDFGGQVEALKQCVKQVGPNLRIGVGSEIATLQLCQSVGNGEKLPVMVQCASKLGRRHVAPSTIAQVCADTSGINDILPHACFLEAQQKLRWMDQAAQISLCTDAAAHAATVPVDCAMELKKTPQKSLTPDSPAYSMFIADLCRSATNSTAVIECVRLLPARAFTADQAVRLCAASSMPAVAYPNDEASVSLYPTSCASQARSLLHRVESAPDSNDLGMSASAAAVLVCEQATSDAPSQCLADTQHEQALSPKLRVQLCQRATSDAPQLCVKSLRRFINAQRLDIYDAVAACRQAEDLGPVDCVTELFRVATPPPGKLAAQLCHAAKTSEPARCYSASPLVYDNELKISLCNEAESTAPALCADSVISRVGNQPLVKVALCRGAASTAPAACAMEAPFGMDEANLVVLCRLATSTAPARCAQEVPAFLRIPWDKVAQVCAGATSTTPGRCLAHQIRHSRLLLRTVDSIQIVSECRLAVARPSALGLAQASYNCPELRPMCPLQLVVNVLDQYGELMTENYVAQQRGNNYVPQYRSNNVVYLSGVFTGSPDQEDNYLHRGQPTLQGSSYATIINGTAVFSNVHFTGAGEFILTFRSGEGVTEEVARVVVHADLTAAALQTRCDELFTRFKCSLVQSSASPIHDYQHRELQELLLPRSAHFNAISCERYWVDNIGGLAFSGFSSGNDVIYALPRPLYDLFTNSDVPRADMSAWALLGLKEGETSRAAIRRAYHRRSLEWHPDKWHALAAALPSMWQQELAGIYALITRAYDQLTSAAR